MSTFADFGCDFESVRRLLDPHVGIDRKSYLPSLSKNQWISLLRVWPKSQASRPYTSLQTVAGGYKEAGKGFPTAGFIDIEESPIIKNSKLYVRKCYPDLYNIIKGGISKVVNIAITGTPGIGKSCFLLYFILRLL